MIFTIKVFAEQDYGIFRARYAQLLSKDAPLQPLKGKRDSRLFQNISNMTQEIADQLMSEFPNVSIAETGIANWLSTE